jgi:hypothetical protein
MKDNKLKTNRKYQVYLLCAKNQTADGTPAKARNIFQS